jgi:nicotinamide riboside kinase
MTVHICLAGVESTGKTTLGTRAARRFNGLFLPEYGREYAETIGTDFSPIVLRSIARIHDQRRERLLLTRPRLLIEDTDVVMTSAWFTMLHGHRDPALSAMPTAAEAYLLFAPDTPWVADGTRQFVGRDRVAFHKVILGEVCARGIAPIIISGNWEQRRDALHDIITARLDMDAASSS